MKNWCAAAILATAAAVPACRTQGEGASPVTMVAGGCEPDTQNILWILATDPAVDAKTGEKYDRKVLLCYKVAPGGRMTDIVDVREVTWDIKLKSLPVDGHNPQYAPDRIRKIYEDAREREAKEREKDKDKDK